MYTIFITLLVVSAYALGGPVAAVLTGFVLTLLRKPLIIFLWTLLIKLRRDPWPELYAKLAEYRRQAEVRAGVRRVHRTVDDIHDELLHP